MINNSSKGEADFIQCLKDIRNDKTETEALVELLEDIRSAKRRYGNRYDQFCIAYAIMLILWYVHGDDKRERLLAMHGLLQGFADIGLVGERRMLYVEKVYGITDEKQKKRLCASLDKQDQKIIEDLAERVVNMALSREKGEGTLGFAAEVAAWLSETFPGGLPPELPLPIPRYLKKGRSPLEYDDIWEQQGNATAQKIMNLPKQNIFFHGREKYLETIEAQFHSGTRIQGVCGIPGAGKTQLALQYAYTHLEEYGTVCWINAENIMTVQKSIVSFLSLHGCLPKENGAEHVKQAFLDFFANRRGWLLVYNNAEYGTEDEYRLLESYIPSGTPRGDILLTTRCRSAFEDSAQMEIAVFDRKEAAAFLRHRIGLDDGTDIESLTEKLGFLPLALEYAAAYIKETPGMDCAAYEKRLDSFGIKLLDRKVGHPAYKNTLREAFHITLDKLIEDAETNHVSKSIEQFLKLCAFLAPDGIDFGIISIYGVGIPAPLGEVLDNELDRDELIRNLARYSLLQIDGGMLSMHRLLQEILRDEIEINDRMAWELYGFMIIYPSYRKRYEGVYGLPRGIARPFLAESSPHMRSVLYWFAKDYQASNYTFKGIPKGHILEDIAKAYFLHTRYLLTHEGTDESGTVGKSASDIPILQEMINFYNMMPTDRNIYLAMTLRLLGEIYESQGNSQMAFEQYSRAVKVTLSAVSKLSDPAYQYLPEVLRLSALICSFICGRSIVANYPRLMWGSYRCLIRVYHIQVSGCPFDEEGRAAFLGTKEIIVSLSHQVADYTQRAFILRLKDLPVMPRDHLGYFVPSDNASDGAANDITNGFELILDGRNRGEVSRLLNSSWVMLAFEKNIRTKEEMLNALIGIKLKKRHISARYSMYSAICVLAKEIHQEDIMRQYNEKLPSWLQYDV